MASRSDVEAGKAHVSLYVKGLPVVQQAMRGVAFAVAGVGAAIAAMGASVLAGFGFAVKSFVDLGSTLNDLSARTGLSAHKLSMLRYMAGQTGASIEDLEVGLRGMIKAGLDPNRFEEIAKSIAAIQDPTLRAQRAMEIFGKSGLKLLPMIMEFQSLKDRALKLGISISDQDVALADKLGDAMDDLKATWEAMVMQVGAALAPVLLDVLGIIQPIVTAVSKWVAENRQLTIIIAAIAGAMFLVGSAVAAILPLVASIATIVSGIVAVMGAGMGALWAAAIIAGLVGITVVIAQVIVLMLMMQRLFVKHTLIGQLSFNILTRMLSDYAARWKEVGSVITSTWSGVVDAIKAGDLGAAFDIALLGMTAAWKEFIEMQLRDIAYLARITGSPIVALIAELAAEKAALSAEDARGEMLDRRLELNRSTRLNKQLADRNAGKDGSSIARSTLIGFNARAALLSANIIGPGASGDPVVGAVEHAEGEIVKAINNLKGLQVAFT